MDFSLFIKGLPKNKANFNKIPYIQLKRYEDHPTKCHKISSENRNLCKHKLLDDSSCTIVNTNSPTKCDLNMRLRSDNSDKKNSSVPNDGRMIRQKVHSTLFFNIRRKEKMKKYDSKNPVQCLDNPEVTFIDGMKFISHELSETCKENDLNHLINQYDECDSDSDENGSILVTPKKQDCCDIKKSKFSSVSNKKANSVKKKKSSANRSCHKEGYEESFKDDLDSVKSGNKLPNYIYGLYTYSDDTELMYDPLHLMTGVQLHEIEDFFDKLLPKNENEAIANDSWKLKEVDQENAVFASNALVLSPKSSIPADVISGNNSFPIVSKADAMRASEAYVCHKIKTKRKSKTVHIKEDNFPRGKQCRVPRIPAKFRNFEFSVSLPKSLTCPLKRTKLNQLRLDKKKSEIISPKNCSCKTDVHFCNIDEDKNTELNNNQKFSQFIMETKNINADRVKYNTDIKYGTAPKLKKNLDISLGAELEADLAVFHGFDSSDKGSFCYDFIGNENLSKFKDENDWKKPKKDLERDRRLSIKQSLLSLASMLASVSHSLNDRLSLKNILDEAIYVIHDLEQQEKSLLEIASNLKKENLKLTLKKKKLLFDSRNGTIREKKEQNLVTSPSENFTCIRTERRNEEQSHKEFITVEYSSTKKNHSDLNNHSYVKREKLNLEEQIDEKSVAYDFDLALSKGKHSDSISDAVCFIDDADKKHLADEDVAFYEMMNKKKLLTSKLEKQLESLRKRKEAMNNPSMDHISIENSSYLSSENVNSNVHPLKNIGTNESKLNRKFIKLTLPSKDISNSQRRESNSNDLCSHKTTGKAQKNSKPTSQNVKSNLVKRKKLLASSLSHNRISKGKKDLSSPKISNVIRSNAKCPIKKSSSNSIIKTILFQPVAGKRSNQNFTVHSNDFFSHVDVATVQDSSSITSSVCEDNNSNEAAIIDNEFEFERFSDSTSEPTIVFSPIDSHIYQKTKDNSPFSSTSPMIEGASISTKVPSLDFRNHDSIKLNNSDNSMTSLDTPNEIDILNVGDNNALSVQEYEPKNDFCPIIVSQNSITYEEFLMADAIK